jgi:hypothetical protein
VNLRQGKSWSALGWATTNLLSTVRAKSRPTQTFSRVQKQERFSPLLSSSGMASPAFAELDPDWVPRIESKVLTTATSLLGAVEENVSRDRPILTAKVKQRVKKRAARLEQSILFDAAIVKSGGDFWDGPKDSDLMAGVMDSRIMFPELFRTRTKLTVTDTPLFR